MNTGAVSHSRVDSVTATGYRYVGGLLGYSSNTGNITSCTVDSASVTASNQYAGGLIGNNASKINSCSATRVVVKVNHRGNVGGLLGYNTGAVSESKVDTVTATGSQYIGGFIGYNSGALTRDTASNTTVTATTSYVGGLVGYSGGTIDNCLVRGITATAMNEIVGGLVGKTEKSITNSSGSNLTVKAGNNAGGLVGVINSSSVILSGCRVDSVRVTATTSYAGGLVGHISQVTSVTSCTVDSASVTATTSHAGGLIGKNESTINSCSATRVVVGCGGQYAGGLLGHNTGAVSNSKVDTVTATGNQYVGGLVGYTDATTISKCCVNSAIVTATNQYAGGLMGYNNANVSDCSVSQATLSAVVTIGGIAALSKGAVTRCLVTGSIIKSTNTNASTGCIAGIVGDNYYGTVSNCVAMIKYYDLKAAYPKKSSYFGRIAANGGNLSNNYGWVETYFKYYHKRFGVNWGTDIYRSTGNVGANLKNGANLYAGNIYPSVSPVCNTANIWNTLGFTSGNGWNTSNVTTDYYPKLAIANSSSLGSIGSERGFEYEAKQIANANRSGEVYIYTSNVMMFTPQFFCNYDATNKRVYAKITSTKVDLYTDILLRADNGTGDTEFWAVDLNKEADPNISSSAIWFDIMNTSPSCFDGHGHSIEGYCQKMGDLPIEYTEGFFTAVYTSLTIKRLMIDKPNYHREAFLEGRNVRFGFLISKTVVEAGSNSGQTITLEDIYVKNPYMTVRSATNNVPYVIDFWNQGAVGTMVGHADKIVGKRLALYVFNYSGSASYNYTSVGGLFGYIQQSITLDSVAIGYVNSGYSLNTQSYYSKEELNHTTRFFGDMSTGYIAGIGTNTVSTLSNCSYYDGYTSGNIGDINGGMIERGHPIPYIWRLNDVNNTTVPVIPNAGSFYNTLGESGIKNHPNWHVPSNNIDSIYLVRDVYQWN